MTLRWGIAATGRIAHTVGAILAAQPAMAVTAVGSRDLGRAQRLAQLLGAAGAHGSYDALVHDRSVDAVYVATPHAQHAAVVEAALLAGKAVLCEKPLTGDLAQTERLVAVARQTGTFLLEAMWMRFNPLVQRLAQLTADGALGELRAVHAAFGFAAPFDPQGRLWAPDLAGGALLDLGVYTVDLARLLLGAPDRIAVAGTLAATGVDAESTLTLSFPGGATALLAQSLVAELPGTATVVGSRGWAELSPTFHAPTRLVVQAGGGEPQEHRAGDRTVGYAAQAHEVARCLAHGAAESAVLPLEQTVATMRVLQEARDRLGAA